MAQTDNIYAIIKHILETYDGVSASDIEYNSIATNRINWKAGKQVIEQKESKDYLNEICEQSFLLMYPTRQGKRGFISWRDIADESMSFDSTNILKDKNHRPLITKFQKQPISEVYNDITINYDWNPGLESFNKQIFCTNTDQNSFPLEYECSGTNTERDFIVAVVEKLNGKRMLRFSCSADPTWAVVGGYCSLYNGTTTYFNFGIIRDRTGYTFLVEYDIDRYGYIFAVDDIGVTLYSHTNVIPLWKTYVGGIASYTEAKDYWNIMHTSYLESKRINKFSIDADWLIENENFGETGGSSNTAFFLFTKCAEWLTLQKYIVDFYAPITSQTLQIELGSKIGFTDQKYTNAIQRFGYVEKTKLIPAKNAIMISLVLIPYNLQEQTYIIESGGWADNIIESGSHTINYIEGEQT